MYLVESKHLNHKQKTNMSLKIVVLAKQVPDTRNVGPDAMTEQGTINRAALPAVFNPEDLNALEQALRLKDQFPGSTISVLTMGLPKSAEVVREALYRGADEGFVVTDRPLGGADTLATSYTLVVLTLSLRARPGRQEDWRLRHHSRWPPGYRRRYRAGRSADCRKARPHPGDLRRRNPLPRRKGP